MKLGATASDYAISGVLLQKIDTRRNELLKPDKEMLAIVQMMKNTSITSEELNTRSS
jgi:hypothetical protein